MRLDRLALDVPQQYGRAVPDWTLGCFIRRSITYANGIDDPETLVVWVQSQGLTGDLRIPVSRPRLAPGTAIEDLDRETLARLASAEGSVSRTSWDGAMMSWGDGPSFQPYVKWPEPARLHRIGTALIEFAPSGIYVEDWRMQPSAPGAVVGLTLISETRHDGIVAARRGGVVLAGDHAVLCLGRPDAMAIDGRAQDYVRASAEPLAAYRDVAACAAHYLKRDTDGIFAIAASTDPLAAGPTALLDGFMPEGERSLRQTILGDDVVASRLWAIDSAAPSAIFDLATPATPEVFAWLAGEADTLLDPLKGRP